MATTEHELPAMASRSSSSSTISNTSSTKSLPPLSSLLQSLGTSLSEPASPTKRHGSTDLLINKLTTPAKKPQIAFPGPPTGVFKEKSPAKKSFSFISHSPATFPSQDSVAEDGTLTRRKRRRTSPEELATLKAEYEIGNTPNKARRVDIAQRLNMTEKAVQIWFQNRRQSMRRKSNNDPDVVVEIPEIPLHPSPTSTTSPESSSPVRSTDFYNHTPRTMPHPSSPVHVPHTHLMINSSPDVAMMPPRGTWATPSRQPASASTHNTNITPVRSVGSTMTFRLSAKKTAGLLTPLDSTSRKNKRPTWKVNASTALGHKEISTSVFSSVDTPSKNSKRPKLMAGEIRESNTFNIYHDREPTIAEPVPVKPNVTNSVLQVKDENVKVASGKRPDNSDIECVENLLSLRSAPRNEWK